MHVLKRFDIDLSWSPKVFKDTDDACWNCRVCVVKSMWVENDKSAVKD